MQLLILCGDTTLSPIHGHAVTLPYGTTSQLPNEGEDLCYRMDFGGVLPALDTDIISTVCYTLRHHYPRVACLKRGSIRVAQAASSRHTNTEAVLLTKLLTFLRTARMRPPSLAHMLHLRSVTSLLCHSRLVLHAPPSISLLWPLLMSI